MTTPEQENSNIAWAKAVTGAFEDVNSSVELLAETVREHTQQRRRDQVFIGILIIVTALFSILELLNLVQAQQVRSNVENVVCESAQDTRAILQPIMDETGLNPKLPPVPEHCQ